MDGITIGVRGFDHPKQKLENLSAAAAVAGVFEESKVRVQPPTTNQQGDSLGLQALMEIAAAHADKIGPIIIFCLGWLKQYVAGDEIEVTFESKHIKISIKAKNRSDVEKVIASFQGLKIG